MELEKALSRRSFLAGVGVVCAGTWLHDSDHIAARSLRSAISDGETVPKNPLKPDWRAWLPGQIHVSWLGHATVLVDFYGVKILTDPVLLDWVGLDLGIATVGEKRVVAPALEVEELPPIDLILLSHAHMDHTDLPTLKTMRKGAKVITAAHTADLARGAGHRDVEEFRWGMRKVVKTPSGELEVEALEVKHWGARWKNDTHRGYNGYLLRRNGRTLIFAGDTAYCPNFQQVRRSKPLAAIMPIGSYGRGSGSHCTPEEAVKMLNGSGSEYIIPVHHSTFPLGKEPLAEPFARVQAAIAEERIAVGGIGEVWSCAG